MKFKMNCRWMLIPALLFSAMTLVFCSENDIHAMNNTQQQNMKITIKAGAHTLTATLEDNATTRALVSKFPLTLPMMDLYGREMCYRFPEALPTDNAYTQGYEVGEIVYYPPMHSLVIMYAQNGERFQMQKLGRIDGDVSIFDGIGDIDVTWSVETSGINAISSEKRPDVKGIPGGVSVTMSGDMRVSIYDTKGTLLNRQHGTGSLELSTNGYKGLALVNIDGRNMEPVRTKIIIR